MTALANSLACADGELVLHAANLKLRMHPSPHNAMRSRQRQRRLGHVDPPNDLVRDKGLA